MGVDAVGAHLFLSPQTKAGDEHGPRAVQQVNEHPFMPVNPFMPANQGVDGVEPGCLLPEPTDHDPGSEKGYTGLLYVFVQEFNEGRFSTLLPTSEPNL